MNRGPVALFWAIIAVGLGPAMWLGAQFGVVDVTPARPTTAIVDEARAPSGEGAGKAPDDGPRILEADTDEPVLTAVPRPARPARTTAPARAVPPSSAAPTSTAPSTEPPPSTSAPVDVPPTEATDLPDDPTDTQQPTPGSPPASVVDVDITIAQP